MANRDYFVLVIHFAITQSLLAIVYIIRLVTWEAIFVRVKWPCISNVDNAFGVDLLDCNLDSCFRNSIVNRLWMYFLPLVSFFHLLPFVIPWKRHRVVISVASRFSSLPFDWREKQKFYFQWQSLRELSVFICWACISPPVYFLLLTYASERLLY